VALAASNARAARPLICAIPVAPSGDDQNEDQGRVMRPFHRGAFLFALCLAPALLAATPAAAGLRFIQAHTDIDPGMDGLDRARGVAVSPDGLHVYVASENDKSVAAFARNATTGVLALVDIEKDGDGGIVDGLSGAHGVAVSPDGANVYVASATDDSLAVFARDAATGALTFIEFEDDNKNGVSGLDGAQAVVVSADGAYVYAIGFDDDAIAMFTRDAATGSLSFLARLANGVDGIHSMIGPRSLALSPDGAHVYVTATGEDTIAVFARDGGTGLLTQLPDAYRDENGDLTTLDVPQGIAISADGAYVYVAAGGVDDAVTVFARNASTGALTFVEAHIDELAGVNGLNGAAGVALSPDGTHLYVAGETDDSVAVFVRNAATGALTYVERQRDGATTPDGVVDGLDGVRGVAVSPDGEHVYSTAITDDAVTVFHQRRCGDGFVDAGEQCDDANTADGDCCSSVCEAIAAGTPCAGDGNDCTDDQCDGAGACAHASNTAPCDDGAWCTVDDACGGGTCQGTPRDCGAAGDQCNDGVCDEDADDCRPVAKADETPCDDGDACTQTDTCTAGACTGADPVVCAASNSCHDAGSCDPGTGICSNPAKADGEACTDGDACTQTDTCLDGTCIGSDPVECSALDQCHEAGTCDPATGVCSNPAKADGTPCDDTSACTQTDTCTAGSCTGADPIVCTALDQCHTAGTCDPASGVCSNPAKPDGASCDDGNGCTESDTCSAGSCTAGDPVVCTALDACHEAGVCDPATGECSEPIVADGTPCDDGDQCTSGDACTQGDCSGTSGSDADSDGVCDTFDLCPAMPDDQRDEDGNGVGDACECSAPAPGHCIPGGGSAKTDCLIEFNPAAPVSVNKKRTSVLGAVRCTDGDPACDRDGAADGQCTFGVAVCLANEDPRFPKCAATRVASFEVMTPAADRGTTMDRDNAGALEEIVGALGVEVRRDGQLIHTAAAGDQSTGCTSVVELVVPAPAGSAKAVKRKVRIRGTADDGRIDTDKLLLTCGR
jgi:DNA-binding beta-propeller fold protein YncE